MNYLNTENIYHNKKPKMNSYGTLHIIIGLPYSGRHSWTKWYNHYDEESICTINNYSELFFQDGTINNNKLIIASEWYKNQVELLMIKREQIILLVLNEISLQEIKRFLSLAHNYEYSVEFNLPMFGYFFYPNELNLSEQINKIKSIKCNHVIKYQIVYSENKLNDIIRNYNSLIKFIIDTCKEIEDPYDPKDWIDRIEYKLQVRRPPTSSPKNKSPRNGKFIYIEQINF